MDQNNIEVEALQIEGVVKLLDGENPSKIIYYEQDSEHRC